MITAAELTGQKTVPTSAARLPETGFLRISDVLKFIPVGRSTFWSKVKTGEYPTPVKLSERCTAWRVQDIRALIERLGSPSAQSK